MRDRRYLRRLRVFLGWTAFTLAGSLFGQPRTESPPQGSALYLSASPPTVAARFGERTIHLFPQQDGSKLGLMPIPPTFKPGDYTVDYLDPAGKVVSSYPVHVTDAHFLKQNVTLAPATQALQPSPGELESVAALRNTVSDTRFWEEPFELPVKGCMTSPYGVQRLYNGKPSGNVHTGLDQRGVAGTPIRSTAAGTVKISRMFNVHGGTVGIDHGQGVTSAYLHMSRILVKEGQEIDKGAVIGLVGSTGRSNGPHLHWGISVNGVQVNPRQWIEVQPCSAAPPPKGQPKARRLPAKKK